MLEVGHVFSKNGYTLCILNVLDYNEKKYVFVAAEKEKIEYLFYEIIFTDVGYKLVEVLDEPTMFALFELVENSKE